MSRTVIPQPVVGVVADVLAEMFTHATMDNAFLAAGAPGLAPDGSKPAKAQAWLIRCNQDTDVDPLAVLGQLLSSVFDTPASSGWHARQEEEDHERRIQRVRDVLTRCGLRYQSIGLVIPVGGGTPSKSLEALLAEHDFEAVEAEFERAIRTCESSPADAVSAACNVLESLCKTYLEDTGEPIPAKKTLDSLWNATGKSLGLDPSAMPTHDLRQILSGLFSITKGIGALRTHASTAHGQGRTRYRVEPRHARLAVHAAHTLAAFVIETWEARKTRHVIIRFDRIG